jgi:hypothetical protein
MSQNTKHFLFSGHAVGAAAQFHRLENLENLDHVVPTLGASVLPVTGGLSKGHVSNYCFDVDEPRRRTLVSLRRADTSAAGRTLGDLRETEIDAEIESLRVVEMLHVGFVKLHLLASRDINKDESKVSTKGCRIDGLELGRVVAKVVLDEEPVAHCGSWDQLAAFYHKQSAAYRAANAFRFGADPSATELPQVKGRSKFSLVREIRLSGTQNPDQPVTVDGYTIIWEGFGKIVLGEVFVKGCERRITMLRLAMGSEAGGSGSVGDGGSNGQVGG